MSDLIAIAYPDKQTAETAHSKLAQLMVERSMRKVTPDKVLLEIQQYGGEVMQTSLDNEAEERLREVLEGASAA